MRLLAHVCAVILIAGTAGTALAQQCVSMLQPVSSYSAIPNRASSAVAAGNGLTGVAKVERDTKALWFGLYDGAFQQVGEDVLVASKSLDGAIAMFLNGSEFVLFYESAEPKLMMQRIGGDGALIGPAREVADLGKATGREVTIAQDGSGFAIVFTIPVGSRRGLWLNMVEADGDVVSSAKLTNTIPAQAFPRATATPAGIVITHNNVNTLKVHAMLVGRDGSIVDRAGFAPEVVLQPHGANPQLVWNGTYVAWVVARPKGNGSELTWVRLDERGETLGEETTFLAPKGIDAEPASLFWNVADQEWALTYADSILGFKTSMGDLWLARLDADGGLISRSFFSPDSLRSLLPANSAIAWNGSAYVGSISRTGSFAEGSQSYLVRHCPLRAQVSASRYANLLQPLHFASVVSGGTPPYTYEWRSGDFLTGAVRAPSATFTYRNTGRYVVTLTVVDSLGARAVTTSTVDVVIPKRRAAGR